MSLDSHKMPELMAEVEALRARNAQLEAALQQSEKTTTGINAVGIYIEWVMDKGQTTFEGLPFIMLWVDTTLTGLIAGVQKMVGTKRFGLALQSPGRNSVEADWQVISQFPSFAEGFAAIANIAAVAGWGERRIVAIDHEQQEACFRAYNSWEGGFQKTMGVSWGSGMLANMSHELRTPLNVILGYAHLLKQSSQLSETDQNQLHLISRSGEHLLSPINQVLDLSKIESGRILARKRSLWL